MLCGLLAPSFSIVVVVVLSLDACSALGFVGEGPEALRSREARGWAGEVDMLLGGGVWL